MSIAASALVGRVARLLDRALGLTGRSTLARRLTGGALGSLGLMVANVFLAFASGLLVARILGAESYGVYAYAGSIVGMLGIVSTFGVNNLLVREIGAGVARGSWGRLRSLLGWTERSVWTLSVTLGIGAAAVALLLRDRFDPAKLDTFLLALLLLPTSSLVTVRRATMRGLGRVVRGQLAEQVLRPAFLVLAVGAAWLVLGGDIGPRTAMGLRVATSVLLLVVASVLLRGCMPGQLRRAQPQPDPRRWISAAVPLAVISAVQTANAQVDLLVLGALAPAAEVGIYAAALRIAQVVVLLHAAVEFTIAPQVAGLQASGQLERLQRLLVRTTRVVTTLSLPVALSFVVFGGPVLSIFGEEFAAGRWALAVLGLTQVIRVAFGPVGSVAIMLGQERASAVIVAVVSLLNVGLNLAFVPRWGSIGAATATAIATLAWNVALFVLVRVRAGVSCCAFASTRLR